MKDIELLEQDPNYINEAWVKSLEDLSIWYYFNVEDIFLNEAHSLSQAAHTLHIRIYELLSKKSPLAPDPKDKWARLLIRAMNCCLAINYSFDESSHLWNFYRMSEYEEEDDTI